MKNSISPFLFFLTWHVKRSCARDELCICWDSVGTCVFIYRVKKYRVRVICIISPQKYQRLFQFSMILASDRHEGNASGWVQHIFKLICICNIYIYIRDRPVILYFLFFSSNISRTLYTFIYINFLFIFLYFLFFMYIRRMQSQ